MFDYLIITEDEVAIARALQFVLKEDFKDITICASAEEAVKALRQRRPDLLLVDWSLPGKSGVDLCRELRADADFATLPIIMVTAHTDVVDAVLGLELGLDDYIRKPYHIKELQSRVHAVLRRREQTASISERLSKALTHGALRVDLDSSEAFLGAQNLELTKLEFNMLKLLMSQPKKTFSRNELLDRVWDEEYLGNPRTVDVYIRHLRQKFEAIDASLDLIKTVRGRGWRLS